jgi:hypothetical protein
MSAPQWRCKKQLSVIAGFIPPARAEAFSLTCPHADASAGGGPAIHFATISERRNGCPAKSRA